MESTLRQGGTDPNLRLIETMLWDGTSVPMFALHLARLAASAAKLGWTVPPIALPQPPTAARLRLTLARDGQIHVEVFVVPPSKPVWHLSLAPTLLHSADPWLTIKSTNRTVYDATRAALPPGIDEAVFANERGEVCDGTITTVFFDAGSGLCTPPLACGLLPGVLRAHMLAQGQCRESTLLAKDLPQTRLWAGNALRGLIPAKWTAHMA
jgi:4-amino-4-deoxychorismate lyase